MVARRPAGMDSKSFFFFFFLSVYTGLPEQCFLINLVVNTDISKIFK